MTTDQPNFRLLFDIFRGRFLENDTVAPDCGFETNVSQVIGAVATPGLFVAIFLLPVFNRLSVQHPSLEIDWTVRGYRLFFPAYSFTVAGFATIFEWDLLFPDRRDFLVLAPFPIRLRDLFLAKFAAIAVFLLTLIAAVNLFPTLLLPVFSMAIPKIGATGILRLTATQIAATVSASLFAFLAVAAFQGVLINLTTPAFFRRISPAIQMLGMSLMIVALLTFPVYMLLLRPMAETHVRWLYLIPPVWFTALYDLLLPGGDPAFARYGIFAAEALAVSAVVFALSWTFGFRRHYRRTLESEDTSSRAPSIPVVGRLIRSPEERAIYDFSGRILARSTTHRLFLATYLSVGISFGLLVTLTVHAGRLGVSRDGLRALPFLIAFFVVSGFRAALQFPAELASNWLFRITESQWAEVSRGATRKRVLAGGLLPAVTLILPFEIAFWGLRAGAMHMLCQLFGGALLIELLFWSFHKVPFTCSYFPGKVNLALLAAFYLYGFTTWSFHMADLERWIDRNRTLGLWFFILAANVLALCQRRHPAASAVLFDASEPEIQVLDLT